MPPRDHAFYARALAGRALPLAYCDLDLFDANARELVARAGGKPIRVASKSVRCRALLERALSMEGFAGVLCFTAAEAAFVADAGFDDLLIAYPTLQRDAVRAIAERVAAGKRIVPMVDDVAQVDRLAEVAREVGVELGLCLDLDVSSVLPGLYFGVRRSPVRGPADALAVARHVARTEGVRLAGVQAYEAQIAGVPDAVPGKRAFNLFVRALKRRSFREVCARRRAVVDALARDGFELSFVNGGGTGSVAATTADPTVTELSAGSGLFAPALFDGYRGYHPLPAVGFALEVVRRPGSGLLTCLGGGYVASGAAGSDRLPVPYLPPGLSLVPHEGAGEVQTPVAFAGDPPVALGDPVFFRHAKAGELCERFAALHLLEAGAVVDTVPTYRGDGQAFL